MKKYHNEVVNVNPPKISQGGSTFKNDLTAIWAFWTFLHCISDRNKFEDEERLFYHGQSSLPVNSVGQ